ncbi:hypothetical protein OG613_46330 (plasmid) [Streptomyces sp. NBC_00015]|uniref:hypothetical protein n=1 Tax=Streptomyces sp. NBC_00015 TaxID=2903611 RepID=UPI002F90B85C
MALADRLPANLRGQFAFAAAFAEGDDPEQWARCTSSLGVMGRRSAHQRAIRRQAGDQVGVLLGELKAAGELDLRMVSAWRHWSA